MEQELEKISAQQKETWNKFSSGWKKWDDLVMDFLKPVGDEIIRFIQPESGDVILDVAAGTGEPGLTIAAMLDDGKVVITDLAEDMLAIAKENAAERGIRNIETVACDVCMLPFEDNTFDAVSCRFGFMFFPDMQMAAKEMMRVLKPGGRVAASVWNGPEKNFWVTAILSTVGKNVEMTPAPPGAPGMFRCAERGMLANLFSQAGLRKISEKEINGKLNAGTAEVYWNMMTELGGPVGAAVAKADDALRTKIKREVFELINETYGSGKVVMDSSAFVICGEK